MALINWPTLSSNLITRFDIAPSNPGQVISISPYSGARAVVSRSPGTWRGNIEIALTDNQEDANKITSFIASLQGSENWFSIPVNAKYMTVIPHNILILTIDRQTGICTTDDPLTDIKVGMFAQVSDRLISIVNVTSTNFTIWPVLPNIQINSDLLPVTRILAYQTPEQEPVTPRIVDFWGPWVIGWEEYLP